MNNKVFEIIIVCVIFAIGFAPLSLGLEEKIGIVIYKASQFELNEQFDDLLALSEEILLEYPNDRDGLYYKGVALKGLGQYVDAQKAIIKSDYISGDGGEKKISLAYYQLGDILFLQDDYTKAIKQMNKVKKDSSKYIDAKYKIGLSYSELGNYTLSQPEFEEVIKLSRSHYQAWHQLGITLYFQGDDDNAILKLEQVTNMKPSFYEAFETLGNVYLNSSQFDNAIESYQRIPTNFENYDRILGKIGLAFWNLENFPEAKNHFNDALILNPDNHEIKSYHDILEKELLVIEIGLEKAEAIRFFEEKNYELAVPLLEKFLKDDEYNYDILLMLGTSYYELEDYPKSEEIFLRILDKVTDSSEVSNLLALSYLKQNEIQSAMFEIELALDKDKKNTKLLNTLADIQMQKEDWDGASETIKFIIEIDESDSQAINKQLIVSSKLIENEVTVFFFYVGTTFIVTALSLVLTVIFYFKPRKPDQQIQILIRFRKRLRLLFRLK